MTANNSSAPATTLPTRRFGHTDMEITRVGFGAWAIGGADCNGSNSVVRINAQDQNSAHKMQRPVPSKSARLLPPMAPVSRPPPTLRVPDPLNEERNRL